MIEEDIWQIETDDLEALIQDESRVDQYTYQAMMLDAYLDDFETALKSAVKRLNRTGRHGGVRKTVQLRIFRTKRTVWYLSSHHNWMFDAYGRLYRSQPSGKHFWHTRVVPAKMKDLRHQAFHGRKFAVSLPSMIQYLELMDFAEDDDS